MQIRIERHNGTLLVPIPAEIAAATGVNADDLVELTSANGHILVSPVVKAEDTLADLVSGITDVNLHSEVDTGPPAGAEVW